MLTESTYRWTEWRIDPAGLLKNVSKSAAGSVYRTKKVELPSAIINIFAQSYSRTEGETFQAPATE